MNVPLEPIVGFDLRASVIQDVGLSDLTAREVDFNASL